MECPKCGRKIAGTVNYCPWCGVYAGDQANLPFETITLTFLRADLTDFTRLSEEMLSEEIMGYLNAIFDQFQKVIESYKGSVYQVIGDEVVAIFGFRKEAGFAPHMAVFAAEEMFNRLLATNARNLIRHAVGLKIGIESDPASIFNLAGGIRSSFIISEGFKKSQLLQKNAENNSALVGENIYRATRAFFSFREAGEIVDQRLTIPSYEIRFKGGR